MDLMKRLSTTIPLPGSSHFLTLAHLNLAYLLTGKQFPWLLQGRLLHVLNLMGGHAD